MTFASARSSSCGDAGGRSRCLRLIDFGNSWDNQSHVGIGGGGGAFDLLQLAFLTGKVPVEGTTWDGEPIVSWVSIYGNWDLLSLIGGSGLAIAGRLPPGADPLLQALKQKTVQIKPPTPPVLRPNPTPFQPPSGELPWNKMTWWQRIGLILEKGAEVFDNYEGVVPFMVNPSPCGTIFSDPSNCG